MLHTRSESVCLSFHEYACVHTSLFMFFNHYLCTRSHQNRVEWKHSARQSKQLRFCTNFQCKEFHWPVSVIGIWPVSLHPYAELGFSANVSLCLCNLEKFVFAESKLTALQNSLHLNTHYCPSFIFLHRPQFSPHLCPNMQSWLGKLSTDCRYSWCFAAFPEIICLSPAVLRILLLPFLQHWLNEYPHPVWNDVALICLCPLPSFIWLGSPQVLLWQGIVGGGSKLINPWQVICGKWLSWWLIQYGCVVLCEWMCSSVSGSLLNYCFRQQ